MTSHDSRGFLSVYIVWIFLLMLAAAYSLSIFFSFFFLSCDSFFSPVMQIDGFGYLKGKLPYLLTEFLEYVARVREQSVTLY